MPDTNQFKLLKPVKCNLVKLVENVYHPCVILSFFTPMLRFSCDLNCMEEF